MDCTLARKILRQLLVAKLGILPPVLVEMKESAAALFASPVLNVVAFKFKELILVVCLHVLNNHSQQWSFCCC